MATAAMRPPVLYHCKSMEEMIKAAFREGWLVEEFTYKAVILPLKGKLDYHGIILN